MLYSIQALRAIAAWIVVAHHYIQIVHGFNEKNYLMSILSRYGSLGVDLFFIISGFVIYLSLKNGKISPMKFAIQRLFRIAPLYWMISIVTTLIIVWNPNLIPYTNFDFLFLAKSLLFIPERNPSGIGFFPVVTVGWTLNYEFLFYSILFFLLILNFKTNISIILGVLFGIFL